jgi:hypothetical protein
VESLADVDIAKSSNKALVEQGAFEGGLFSAKQFNQALAAQFITKRLNPEISEVRMLIYGPGRNQFHKAEPARVVVDNPYPFFEIEDDMVMGRRLGARVVKSSWCRVAVGLLDPERSAHPEVANKCQVALQVKDQVFGSSAEPLYPSARQAVTEAVRKRKSKIWAPLFYRLYGAARHYRFQTATDGFNLGKFRHSFLTVNSSTTGRKSYIVIRLLSRYVPALRSKL